MIFASRTVNVQKMPLPAGVAVAHPEQLILRFGDGRSVDVGALCYLRRERPLTAGKAGAKLGSGRRVDLGSFSVERSAAIRRLVEFASEQINSAARRPLSVYANLYHLSRYLDWADENGCEAALDEPTVARTAFAGYIGSLRERIRLNEINQNSGANGQKCLLDLLPDFLGIDDLHSGIFLLKVSRKAAESTQPPCEDAQAKILSLCGALFTGIADLVLGGAPYPHPVAMPRYLGLPDDTLWVFPVEEWFKLPAALSDKGEAVRGRNSGYNYQQGRLSTAEEVIATFREIRARVGDKQLPAASERRSAGMSIEKAAATLLTANNDARYRRRLDLAQYAVNLFTVLFVAHTGMNWAVARSLAWGADYEVSSERQGFRAIKCRAGGKLVSFEIQPVFLATFKRFIELRSYLLGGEEPGWLFFNARQRSVAREIEPIGSDALAGVHKSLRGIDPTLPKIMARQWRAGKSDYLLRTTDPSTTAMVLQNTEATVFRSYAEGSPTTHAEEMSSLFDQISAAVVPAGLTLEHGTERAVGSCTAFGKPAPLAGSDASPDCRSPEGCLFCDKYRIHADERDIRKLLSCRFCLRQTAPLAGSEEQHHQLFGSIFDRIEELLAEIGRRDSDLVEQVRREVEESGELDPYWAGKLEMLFNLEMVI